jgi:hypothetical protein
MRVGVADGVAPPEARVARRRRREPERAQERRGVAAALEVPADGRAAPMLLIARPGATRCY